MHGLVGGLMKAQLLAGVRRVGNELADKDLFVGVKGMNDDIQQLLNLRLKMMGLGLAHKP